MQLLADWLCYLETLHFKSIDMGLERVSAVAKKLIHAFECPVITVAGTNGKGSCVAVLESVLLAAGYRVGAYTSPHLLKYNERVRIQGEAVSDEDLCRAFEEIEQARGETSLTYFEFGSLAALRLFQQANLDIVILEVGLGGRLDAVNIIDSDIAIITTIDLDHMDWLGHNREAIGYEKAGIMRAGKPVICGDFDVPQSIYTQAEKLQAPLYIQNRDFGYIKNGLPRMGKEEWSWWGESRHLMHLPIPVLELQNVATAFKALELLSVHPFHNTTLSSCSPLLSFRAPTWSSRSPVLSSRGLTAGSSVVKGEKTLDPAVKPRDDNRRKAAGDDNKKATRDDNIKRDNNKKTTEDYNRQPRDDSYSILISKYDYESGLHKVFLPGRFQIKKGEVTHIFDVAHNPAGGRWLANRLAAEPCQGRTFAMVGMLADKDQRGTLEPLISQIDRWYVAGLDEIPRGCSAEKLGTVLDQLSAKQVKCYSCVSTAYREAIHAAVPGDRIVIFGSFHTVSAGLLC